MAPGTKWNNRVPVYIWMLNLHRIYIHNDSGYLLHFLLGLHWDALCFFATFSMNLSLDYRHVFLFRFHKLNFQIGHTSTDNQNGQRISSKTDF
ncbi:hypothetical protein E2C01_001755 [Portunus trituberculatus]|uniref:Uncharacterized protein n=1 Tax=Portunus trituberculatus TaxID=210409 RepID=A0A5B7CHH6_PORTR|nr:hypothetical protein [Portunus trituberculatus]